VFVEVCLLIHSVKPRQATTQIFLTRYSYAVSVGVYDTSCRVSVCPSVSLSVGNEFIVAKRWAIGEKILHWYSALCQGCMVQNLGDAVQGKYFQIWS